MIAPDSVGFLLVGVALVMFGTTTSMMCDMADKEMKGNLLDKAFGILLKILAYTLPLACAILGFLFLYYGDRIEINF